DPSGILNFASSLLRMARSTTLATVLLGPRMLYLFIRTTERGISLFPALFGDHGRIHIHPRPQHRRTHRVSVQHNLHRNALHHFHVIARRVFRRQQTQHSASRACNRIHMPAESPSIRIDFHFRFLPRAHISQLRLFKVRCHPHILQRHHHQQSLPRLYDLSGLHLLVRSHSVHRRDHIRVPKIQNCCVQRRSRLRHFCHFRLRISRAHADLFLVRLRSLHSSACLHYPRLSCVLLRFRHFHIALRLCEFFLICLQRARRCIGVCFCRVVLLLRNLVSLHQRLVPG